jgi:hypothetical protein
MAGSDNFKQSHFLICPQHRQKHELSPYRSKKIFPEKEEPHEIDFLKVFLMSRNFVYILLTVCKFVEYHFRKFRVGTD